MTMIKDNSIPSWKYSGVCSIRCVATITPNSNWHSIWRKPSMKRESLVSGTIVWKRWTMLGIQLQARQPWLPGVWTLPLRKPRNLLRILTTKPSVPVFLPKKMWLAMTHLQMSCANIWINSPTMAIIPVSYSLLMRSVCLLMATTPF